MEVSLCPSDFVLGGDPAPLPKRGQRLPIFGIFLLWPNGWLHQDATCYGGRPQPRRLCVSPQFSAHVFCGQTAVCTRISLGMEVGTSLGDIVLDGVPALPPLKGHSPQFSANVRCGQTAGWTKMTLGMEVGLGTGDFVFDGDPAPQKKGAEPPVFGSCLLWPNGWMDEDASWYGSRPRPKPHCVRRGPSSPGERGTAALPFFSAHVYCGDGHGLSYCFV